MLAMRGISLSYETVREWCLKFGQPYANSLRQKSPRSGDRWHLDEVFRKFNRRLHYQVVGTCDEEVQVSRPRATFSLGPRNHYLTLLGGATSVQREQLPGSVEIEICCVERGDSR